MPSARERRAASSDGRVLRGERSRQAIADALFALVGEGVLQPTAQQIADRAGVAIRSVFRHLSDLDSMHALMEERLEHEALRLIAGGVRDGDLAARARGLVRQRALLFERIAPYKRAANVQRWRSAFLQRRHERMQRALRADLLRWLPELAGAPADLVEAADLATSFDAWDRLRGDRRVGLGVATAAVTRLLAALLADADAGRTPTRHRAADAPGR